jgi:hypothetical protein
VGLKFTFRRFVDRDIMIKWEEVVQIVSSIQFSEEEDATVYQFNSSDIYSMQW